MDEVIALILLLLLLFVGSCIYSFVLSLKNRNTLSKMKNELNILRTELATLQQHLTNSTASPTAKAQPATVAPAEPNIAHESLPQKEQVRFEEDLAEMLSQSEESFDNDEPIKKTTPKTTLFINGCVANIVNNWMIWLGGISVGLAGIFMVKYSIDKGLLSPLARVVISIIVGIALHGVAEYLRRRQGHHPALAALCGGASITLFAALLAAHHLYDLFPAIIVFGALTLVSLATMCLAVIHGPILAILGILAAYSLPLLINTGSSNVAGALSYITIITASALILTRYVVSYWLWYCIVLLSSTWALLGIVGPSHEPLSITIYLGVLAYMLTAIPYGDWRLSNSTVADCLPKHPIKRFLSFSEESDKLFFVLIGISTLQALNLFIAPFAENWLYIVPVLPVLSLIIAGRKDDYSALGWISFIALLVPLLAHFISQGPHIKIQPPSIDEQNLLFILFGALFAIYSLFGLINLRYTRYESFPVSLAASTPIILLAIIYSLMAGMRNEPLMIALCLATGVILFLLASRLPLALRDKGTLLTFLVTAHFAYALAAVYLFQEATLTLALSTVFISLAFARKAFSAPELDWVLKGLVCVVVARLTFNPFLLQYSPDSHWSLWTYGGSALCAIISCRLLPSGVKIRFWLEGAALQLVLLFIASEMRYQLYDGQIFSHQYNSIEAAINTLLWSGAGLVYLKRSALTESFMATFYTILSTILLVMAAANHVIFSLIKYNPLFSFQNVSTTPVVNIILLAYGLPILPMVCAWYFGLTKRIKEVAIVTGLSLFFFISMEIRHFYTPEIHLRLGTGNAEIYTYSVVWLLIAVTAIIFGAKRNIKTCYQAGMVTILGVVAKIFFIDMSELEGLYRVASFMGLGISLLAISFLHKWLQKGLSYNK